MMDSNAIQRALQAAKSPLLLETRQQLEAAACEWSETDLLGVDTEFVRERTYWAELGLVQVSNGETAWLVDVVKIRELEALKTMFVNPGILKIFHSSSEDFEALWHALEVSPQPVADTQIACAMAGQPLQMSYHNAIKWLTGIEVDKDQTRSNWLRRPLSEKQLHYAATDVVFLPMLLKEVRQSLEQQNKWEWLEEDVQRAIVQSRESLDPNLAYLRLGAAANLEQRQLRVLRELAAWREVQAVKRNLARSFVVSDVELLIIARNMPISTAEISALDGLNQRNLQKYQTDIIAAVGRGLDSNVNANALCPLDKNQKRLINEMRDLVQYEAVRHGVDPALLASRKVLESLLRAVESGEETPERLTGWRNSVITEKLLGVISASR